MKPRVTLAKHIALAFALWVTVGLWSFFAGGCGVSPAAHVANVGEATQYAAELTDCRAKGREAKKDGGAQAYMDAYEACAEAYDRKHGLDGGAK